MTAPPVARLAGLAPAPPEPAVSEAALAALQARLVGLHAADLLAEVRAARRPGRLLEALSRSCPRRPSSTPSRTSSPTSWSCARRRRTALWR
jgi:hypothetical protein